MTGMRFGRRDLQSMGKYCFKNQRVKKAKPLICSTSKTSLEIKNLPEDMTITPWRTIQGVYQWKKCVMNLKSEFVELFLIYVRIQKSIFSV